MLEPIPKSASFAPSISQSGTFVQAIPQSSSFAPRAIGDANAENDAAPNPSSSMPIRSFSLTSGLTPNRTELSSPPPGETSGTEEPGGRHSVMTLSIPVKTPGPPGRGSTNANRKTLEKVESIDGPRKSGRESLNNVLTVQKVFSLGASARENSARRSALLGALNDPDSSGPEVVPQRSFLTQENMNELKLLAQKASKKDDSSVREGLCSKLQRQYVRARLHLWLFLEEPFDTWCSSLVSGTMVLTICFSICHGVAAWDRERLLSSQPVSEWDIAFGSIFFVDLTLRFWSYPATGRFLKDVKNVIDVVCLMPFFLNSVLGLPNRVSELEFLRWLGAYDAFLRLLKLSRYFWGWRLLFHAIFDSAKALIIPMMFLVIVVLFFSCTFYIAEVLEVPDDEEDTTGSRLLRGGGGPADGLVYIDNLPDSIHFCIISILGISTGPYYGLEAASFVGRAGVCGVMLFGMLFMAMPIAIVGNCFSQTWFDQDRIILLQKMRDRLQAQGYSSRDLEDVFDQVDENGSGELDYDNFRRLVATFNLRSLNAAKCRQLFHFFDNDADGVINFSDFALTLYPDEVEIDEEDDSDSDSEMSLPQYDSEDPSPPEQPPRLLSPVGEMEMEGRSSGTSEDIGEIQRKLLSPEMMVPPRLSDIPEIASNSGSARPSAQVTDGDCSTTTWAVPARASIESVPIDALSDASEEEEPDSPRSPPQASAALRGSLGSMGSALSDVSADADVFQTSKNLPPRKPKRKSEDSDYGVGVCALMSVTSIGTSRSRRRSSDRLSVDWCSKRDSEGYVVMPSESLGAGSHKRNSYGMDSVASAEDAVIHTSSSMDSRVMVMNIASMDSKMTHKIVGERNSGSWEVQGWEEQEEPLARTANDHDAESPYTVAVVASKNNLEPEDVGKRSSLLSLSSERSDCNHLSPTIGKRVSNCSFTSDVSHLSPAPLMDKRHSNCSFSSETPLRDHDPLSALETHENSTADFETASMISANFYGPHAKSGHESHPALAPIEAAMARMEACMERRFAELRNTYVAQMGGPGARPGTSTNLFHGAAHHLGVHLKSESRSRGTTPRSSLWHHKKKDRDEDHHDTKHRFGGFKSQPQSRKPSFFAGNPHSHTHGDQGHWHKERDGVSTSHDQLPPHSLAPSQVAGTEAAQQPQALGASPTPQARPKRLMRAKTTGFNRLLKK